MRVTATLVIGGILGMTLACFEDPEPSCGDGIVEGREECDDANTDETDDCLTTCEPASCGDGHVQAGVEACDDGEFNGQGTCTIGCTIASCGDGFLQELTETCDDGNQDSTDECVACEPAFCGDGYTQAGVEECDDANGNNNDKCLDSCRFATCGDGIVELGVEGCDDGNMIDDDGCTNACSTPGCGDGILTENEECDDGNNEDDDGCSAVCVDEFKRAFVTSQTYPADLGGHDGADAKCQQVAGAAGLVGTYRAWLSTMDVSAADHLTDPLRPYVNMAGQQIAADWQDLFDGELGANLIHDETGAAFPTDNFGFCSVWTGTQSDGTAADPAFTCENWTVSNPAASGHAGNCNSPSGWTDYGTEEDCDLALPIYCFQQ